MSKEPMSNWWDVLKGSHSFEKTENHIFAPYTGKGKRIGDMTRDELIKVIATGYHEREDLAKALCHLASNDEQPTVDIAEQIRRARRIVDRLKAEGKL